MSREAWAEISEQIKKAQNILVISHQSPDPDAFGSSCGLTLALRFAGKNAVCLNSDGVCDNLSYIPHAKSVTNVIPAGNWELIIICDCGDKKRVGEDILNQLPTNCPVVNIDHHYSNTNYGDFNLVEGNASSACEVVFELISDLLGALTPEVAECLLTGIIADTGGFRYSSTSAHTFLVAEKLVKAGADLVNININLFANRPLSAVRLAAAAVSSMNIYADGKLTEMIITDEMMEACQAVPTDCEGLVDSGRDIAGVCASILTRRVDDVWKVSLRSKYSNINVSEVAALFGGGGHVQAAAFRWNGELEDFRQKLLDNMCRVVNEAGK